MKILGIDPGTAIVGWGIIEVLNDGQKPKVLSCGIISTDSKSSDSDQLEIIYDSLCDIINKEKPEVVAVEKLFFFKNQKTVMTVSQSRGVILLAVKKSKLPFFEYTPLQVKQALTGYGRADKKQIQEMVRVTCGLKTCPKPDDAADALAIAICCGQTAPMNNELSK
ncbi:MAG: crossover junction endodeoxyribonuclease RuvC [Candidatus Berkelbacteria bacterium Athens1014_28]|uniref:Crossover junction endodeoxyribonuclease RuvC n=1 Tax=Candidatus Berkelbacteria bacterium Athens1014_28 TaxID=2017145 RepID=A0A554LKA1_9BACT|nr:MAG: crossover junction endodeoxyribonuclease RuvC [Candidatus Berkelbacteria bacterium Athens1014_28]